MEDTVFKVHSYLFATRSTQWARKVVLPEYSTRPIVVNDVSANEMEAFLSMLYPRCAIWCTCRNPNLRENCRDMFDSHTECTVEVWCAVLRLATEWDFSSIRATAIQNLEHLVTPLEKLLLGRARDVSHWIHFALFALCTRQEPLTIGEARQMLLEDVVLIAASRETAHRYSQPSELLKQTLSAYLEESGTIPVQSPALQTPSTSSSAPVDFPVASPQYSASTPAGERYTESASTVPTFTLSDMPTGDEKTALECIFGGDTYRPAIGAVKSSNAPAFTTEFVRFIANATIYNVARGAIAMKCLIVAALHRAATESSFVPVAADLVVIIQQHLGQRFYHDTSREPALRRLREFLSAALENAFKVFQEAWDGAVLAYRSYGDAGLAFAQSILSEPPLDVELHRKFGWKFGKTELVDIYDVCVAVEGDRHSVAELYNSRTANLHNFFSAIIKRRVFTAESVSSFRLVG